MRQGGFSTNELLVALVILALLMIAAVPALADAFRNARVDAATRKLASDLGETRSRAILTGWEFRLIGFSAGSSNPRENQYRVMGRRSAATPWPDDTAAPFQSATQFAGAWVEVESLYPGTSVITEDPMAQPRFGVEFDVRGAATEVGGVFNPLEVAGKSRSRALEVSRVGRVTVQ